MDRIHLIGHMLLGFYYPFKDGDMLNGTYSVLTPIITLKTMPYIRRTFRFCQTRLDLSILVTRSS